VAVQFSPLKPLFHIVVLGIFEYNTKFWAAEDTIYKKLFIDVEISIDEQKGRGICVQNHWDRLQLPPTQTISLIL
jgi:hypothetical protein